MKAGARGAFFYFDCFRLVAALAVVIEHVRDLLLRKYADVGSIGLLWKALYFGTGFGHAAVIVFFVLSGFWISKTVDRRIDGPRFWADYLVDRLSRLLIVLVPALLLGAAFDWTGVHALGGSIYAGTSGSLTIQYPVAERLGLVVLLGNLAFVQTLLVETLGSNGALWSLTNEFWYYICYPALVLLLARRLSGSLLALAVLALFPHLLPGFAVWLMGSAVYHADRRWRGRVSRRAGAAVLVVATLLLAANLGAARVQYFGSVTSDLLVGAAFAGLCWALLVIDPKPVRALGPVSRYGANASYSLYVTHLPLVVLLAAWLMRGPGHGERLLPGGMALLAFAAVVLGAVAWGWLFAAMTEARTPLLRDRVKALLGLRKPEAVSIA
ncbi:acyltransferase [Novosphingobium sp.]|uniref:acyltransferase family protein n=1 Tax=Novosphingobium sp. TaxID=1874826 RepID=UPI0025CDAF5D|nr:acyltransferase [Novosphingobium sp.]